LFRFLHGADFHLDSPFTALSREQAASRRAWIRALPDRLAEYVRAQGVELVLLAGDLLDTGSCYRETAEALRRGLERMAVPVFIAPGNHDWYGAESPYAAEDWPENVHIFRTGAVESVELPALNAVVHGAAFTAPEQETSLLRGFSAPADGRVHLMVLHGEVNAAEARYDPLTKEEIAASGLAYLALGHIHKRTEPLRLGGTLCAWPGCPEGRGFDELGDRGVYLGRADDSGAVSLRFAPFARHRYEILRVDVTDRTPLEAVEAALPQGTEDDLYRIILEGSTGEAGVDLTALGEALSGRFCALELRDETRIREELWARAGEDSLRGLFLGELREKLEAAGTDGERELIRRAAGFGLAALDHRDLG
jgi:exonuclease SbcD